MTSPFISAFAFLAGILVSMVLSCRSVSKGAQLQQEILKRGRVAQGRVLKVWKPWLAGSFARVYFEFEPEAGGPVQSCHVDRRTVDELAASLPAVGSSVGIKYLPENPTNAVIAKLVSRFRS